MSHLGAALESAAMNEQESAQGMSNNAMMQMTGNVQMPAGDIAQHQQQQQQQHEQLQHMLSSASFKPQQRQESPLVVNVPAAEAVSNHGKKCEECTLLYKKVSIFPLSDFLRDQCFLNFTSLKIFLNRKK